MKIAIEVLRQARDQINQAIDKLEEAKPKQRVYRIDHPCFNDPIICYGKSKIPYGIPYWCGEYYD